MKTIFQILKTRQLFHSGGKFSENIVDKIDPRLKFQKDFL